MFSESLEGRVREQAQAIERLRKRNRELEQRVKELEDRELDRLQLGAVASAGSALSDRREVVLLQQQRAQAVQEAADARVEKEQLQRAVKQYERLLEALGVAPRSASGVLASQDRSLQAPWSARQELLQSGEATTKDDRKGGKGWLEGMSRLFTGKEEPASSSNGANAPVAVERTGSAGTISSGDGMRIFPALPQNLSDMLSFTLETDEGPVTVRARASGSLAYLKRMIAVQLYLSPRLELRLATLKGDALRDDMIIQPYADDNVTNEADRLQLSVSPRPLSELAPGAPGLPPLQQIRVRTIIPGSSQALTVLVKPVRPDTTAAEVVALLVNEPALRPIIGSRSSQLKLYFSLYFLTPDVLLSRKKENEVLPETTLHELQVIDDDMLYFSTDF
ncbi:hypothetical protein AB1Y20_019275 [Prymnesium parvum]|uniref:Ubiquitin-like domain-containing protein n=1 Tax=Prymnesium parvum TaxID=97485 RepID=A0AB34JUI3_PRYPA